MLLPCPVVMAKSAVKHFIDGKLTCGEAILMAGLDRAAFCKLCKELLLQIKSSDKHDFQSLVCLLLSHDFLLSWDGF